MRIPIAVLYFAGMAAAHAGDVCDYLEDPSQCRNEQASLKREAERLERSRINERAATCDINQRSSDPFCDARRRVAQTLAANSAPKDIPACSVWIASRRAGETVIVDGEHVGDTPVLVNLRPFGLCGEMFSATTTVAVKVAPRREGCVQIERIGGGRHLPSRMMFDTRICPIGSDINVNVW